MKAEKTKNYAILAGEYQGLAGECVGFNEETNEAELHISGSWKDEPIDKVVTVNADLLKAVQ